MSALENYRRSRQQPAQESASGWGSLLLIAAIALLCIYGLSRNNRDDRRHDRQDQHHEQVQPVDGGMLVFVSDKQFPTVDQDLVMRGMDQFCKARGLAEGFRWLDDMEPAGVKMIEYAKGKGIAPPLVAYVRDKQIKRVASWAATGESELEKFLK